MLTIKPKTRKEIYLAYLSGDMSLELPEPLTRDEVNLYNLCKNKAYGEYTTVKEVLAECQAIYHATGDTDGTLSSFGIGNPFEIVPGEKYIVRWNGTDYLSTAVGIEGVAFLGNLSTVGMEDTGEPFVMQMTDGTPEAPGHPVEYALVIPLDGSTTLTISIRQEVTEVQKISGKYVEGMGWRERADYLSGFAFESHDLRAATPVSAVFDFVEGESYTVIFDGEKYECTAFSLESPFGTVLAVGNSSIMMEGEQGDGEPFFVYTADKTTGYVSSSVGKHTISIYQETIHPIDQKFLPSAFVVNFATADMQNWTADKTADEIAAMVNAGKEVYGMIMGSMKVDFLGLNPNGSATFGRVIPDAEILMSYHLAVMTDNSVEATLASLTMTPMGGGPV